MVGERLAVRHAELGGPPTWVLPAELGPLSDLELSTAEDLGPEEWRYWVARGWASVYAD